MPFPVMLYLTFACGAGVFAHLEESVLATSPRWCVIVLKAAFWPALLIPWAGPRLWRL